jgi:hypothetical protein
VRVLSVEGSEDAAERLVVKLCGARLCSICEVRVAEVCLLETCGEEVRSFEVCSLQARFLEAGVSEFGFLKVGRGEVRLCEVGVLGLERLEPNCVEVRVRPARSGVLQLETISTRVS